MVNDKHDAVRGKTVIMSLHSEGLDWVSLNGNWDFAVDALAQIAPSPVVSLLNMPQNKNLLI